MPDVFIDGGGMHAWAIATAAMPKRIQASRKTGMAATKGLVKAT
jgi:hypothetical protein